MGYLSNICESIASSFIPRKSSTNQQALGTERKYRTRTTAPIDQRMQDSMAYTSGPSPSDEYGRTRSGLKKRCISKGHGQTIVPSDYMLPTPLTSNVKRKRDAGYAYVSVPQEQYDDIDLDGPTLIDDHDSVKRPRVSRVDGPLSPCDFPLKATKDDFGGDDDGTFLEKYMASSYSDLSRELDASQPSIDSELDKVDLGEGYGIHEGDTLTLLQSDTDRGLSDIDSGSNSISDLISEYSDDDLEEDEILPPFTPGKTQRTPRSRSKQSNGPDTIYRPSPKVVDKSLSKQIVRRDAHESDLSDDEIWSKVNTVRKSEATVDFSMEKARRWAAAVKLPAGEWADSERDLYFRLAMRGFEPMLPSNWKMDFNTLPTSLFSDPGDTDAFLSPIDPYEFRAIKYLGELFSLGGRVRDQLLCRVRPEPIIQRTIVTYIQWALQDANIYLRPKSIPVYIIYSLKAAESTKTAIQIINRRLTALANWHRNAWEPTPSVEFDPGSDNNLDNTYKSSYRSFPVLTGFLICGPIVALMTMDSSPKTNRILDSSTAGRFISQFDLSEFGQDVWNALAVAIAVIRMRKTMIELEKENGRHYVCGELNTKPAESRRMDCL